MNEEVQVFDGEHELVVTHFTPTLDGSPMLRHEVQVAVFKNGAQLTFFSFSLLIDSKHDRRALHERRQDEINRRVAEAIRSKNTNV